MGNNKIMFKPYTKDELINIIKSKGIEYDKFNDDAKKLCCVKVSAINGDLRRVIQILLRAKELYNLENKRKSKYKKIEKEKEIKDNSNNINENFNQKRYNNLNLNINKNIFKSKNKLEKREVDKKLLCPCKNTIQMKKMLF